MENDERMATKTGSVSCLNAGTVVVYGFRLPKHPLRNNVLHNLIWKKNGKQ